MEVNDSSEVYGSQMCRLEEFSLDHYEDSPFMYLTYLIRSSYTLWCRRCFFFIILQMLELLGRLISLLQGRYLNTGQHKHGINKYTYHSLCGIRTHDPGFRASEDCTCLRCAATMTGRLHIAIAYLYNEGVFSRLISND
jgi:hypothetical protein